MGATLGVATLQTEVDQKGIEQGFKKSEKKTKKFAGRIGDALSTGIGIAIGQQLFALTGRALRGLMDQITGTFKALARIERIGAQTEAVIKSTGGAAGITRQELDEMAESMENLTASEAEAITEAGNILLTFTQITEDVFPDTLSIVNDMSRALGTDLSQQAIQVGKAINDPILGITALQRVGVAFTQDQKDVIASLVETGDVAGAQKIILDELSKEFGGSGEAFAQTMEGQQELFEHQVGTIKETILGAFLPAISDGIGGLNELVRSEAVQAMLDNVVDWMQNNAVPILEDFLALVTDLFTHDLGSGPLGWLVENKELILGVLGGIGVILASAAISAAVGAIGGVLAAINIPLIAIIGAIALLSVAWQKDWGGMRTIILNWWEITKAIWSPLIEILKVFMPQALARLKEWFGIVWGFVRTVVFPIIATLAAWLGEHLPVVIQTLVSFWQDVLLPAITAVWEWMSTVLFPFFELLAQFFDAVFNVVIMAMSNIFTENIQPAIEAVWKFISTKLWPIFKRLGTWLDKTFRPVLLWLADFLNNTLLAAWEAINDALLQASRWLSDIIEKLKRIKIPGALDQGSPSPFEQSLLDVNAELAEMAGRTITLDTELGRLDVLPNPASVLASPVGAAVGGGTVIVNVDTMIGERSWMEWLARQLKPEFKVLEVRDGS